MANLFRHKKIKHSALAVSATVFALCLTVLTVMSQDENILETKEARFFLLLAGFSSAFTYELVGQSLPNVKKKIQTRNKTNARKVKRNSDSEAQFAELLSSSFKEAITKSPKRHKGSHKILLYILIVFFSGLALYLIGFKSGAEYLYQQVDGSDLEIKKERIEALESANQELESQNTTLQVENRKLKEELLEAGAEAEFKF